MEVGGGGKDIAKEQGMDLGQILTHDIFPSSPIFNGDLPAHVNKSKYINEIHPQLDLSQWSMMSALVPHVVVDFMSRVLQMPLHQFPTLGAAVNAIITSASHLSQDPQFIHLVLDSYIEMSLKAGEHL